MSGTGFDDLGRVTSRTLSLNSTTGTAALRRGYSYDTSTGLIATVQAGWTTVGSSPSVWFQNDAYSRDGIGNVTQIVDNGVESSGVASAVKECFLYDSWNRLVRATSAAVAAACPTGTNTATIATGTRDAYDTTWVFNDVNRMVSRTDKLTAAVTTYVYGDGAHPSAPTATTGGTTGTYGYNALGAMTSRNGTSLSYDALQRLSSYGSVESYRYSVSNQRLMRTAGTTRTLYLPGVEVTDTAGTVKVTRFLTIGGANIATKTTTGAATGVAWNCGSLQNSTVCQADSAAPNVVPARKRYAPYGGDRNAVTFTTTDHQFLGQPDDTTGLTYLNNRYYDPSLGAFTSVDPLVGKTGTPYLYAAGSPSTLSDPTGLSPWDINNWLFDVFFGSLVHSLIQADYMSKYSDSYAEVGYSATDLGTETTNRGRIDLAAFDPTENPTTLLINEIRPTVASAKDNLEQREADLDGMNVSLKVPYVPAVDDLLVSTVRDNRPFDESYTVLGATVHARRNGAGIITYSYSQSGDLPLLSDLLRRLRDVNREMRERRGSNVEEHSAEFDQANNPALLPEWLHAMVETMKNFNPSPCVDPCTK